MSTTIHVQQSNVSHHSRTVTLLLCIFLGGFGAHHFYVGRSGSGVLLLLLSWFCGIGFIWVLIDFIMILTGSFPDSFGRMVSSWDGGPQPAVSVTTHPPPQQQRPQPVYSQPMPPPPQKKDDEIFCNTCGALSKKLETYCRSCGAVLQH